MSLVRKTMKRKHIVVFTSKLLTFSLHDFMKDDADEKEVFCCSSDRTSLDSHCTLQFSAVFGQQMAATSVRKKTDYVH